MKRIIFLIFVITFQILNVEAQDSVLVSKKGIPILPAKGDWAIGIDATPFFKIFNDYSDIGFNFVRNNVFIGKKFISSKLAYRVKLRLGFHSETKDGYVIKDGQIIPDPNVTVTDTKTSNYGNVTLGFGLEKRMGYGRLQAFYGGELLISFHNASSSYTYGNSYSFDNPNPSSYNFGTNIHPEGRVTYYDQGLMFGGTIRAFIGVEYFFAPKISIGGEFGWGPNYLYSGEGVEKLQSWNPQNSSVEYYDYKTGSSSEFTVDNDNFGGAIYFLFHFK